MKKIDRILGDPGALSSSKSITFIGLNYEVQIQKGKYEYRSYKAKWYNSSYFRLILLSAIEISFYLIFNILLFAKFTYLFGVIFILGLLTYTFIYSGSKRLRMNHGAEHKVLNAFSNNCDLTNTEKYSRFSETCGSSIYSILILLISLSQIIKFPLTIFLIYYVLQTKFKFIRYLVFNSIGKAMQYITTLEPTKEILDDAKNGFIGLLYAELKLEDLTNLEK